jgi:hypothetical protein
VGKEPIRGTRGRRGVLLAMVTAAIFFGANGTASAATVSPANFDFGSQSVGTTSAPHFFLLTEYCTSTLDPPFCDAPAVLTTSIGITGPFVQTNNCPDQLVAVVIGGASCTIQVSFVPCTVGPATGTLSTGGPTAELHGTGVAGSGCTPPASASNQFTFGKLKLNRSQGTATLTVGVPGPGTLTLGGKGIVAQRPATNRLAALRRIVTAAGKVKLKIKPRGKAKAKLNHTGRATVKAKVTFTPSGGASASKTKKIRLKKNL